MQSQENFHHAETASDALQSYPQHLKIQNDAPEQCHSTHSMEPTPEPHGE